MFMNPSLVFDIICTVVWLSLAMRYARRGLAAVLVQGLGNLASLLGARQIAAWGSQELFQDFFAVSFQEKIAATIAEGGAIDLDQLALRYAGFLPEELRRSIVEACERSLAGVLGDNALVMADAIVQQVIRPLITPVISIVLFFVAFALFRMLVSLLVTVLGLVNRLPVLGTVNRALGFAAGVAASLVDLFLLLCIVWAIVVVTGGGLSVLNESLLNESLYYRAFNLLNPFL